MGSGLFSVPTLGEQIESLQRGDHVCAISSGTSPFHSVIVPFVRRCLARREMCFYAIGERAEEDVAAELIQAGIDFEQACEEGGLALLRNREFMPFEEFDPSAFIELFRARAQRALNAGFYGVGFAVEMNWGLQLKVPHDAVIEVEQRLNAEFFPNARAVAICIYERRLCAEFLRAALHSHPLAIVDDKLISDPFYEPPALTAQSSEAARVDWMITQLVRWADDREELRSSHDRLRALIENAADGVTVLDADGRILYEGPSAERLLGYKPEEMVGRHFGVFVGDDDVDPIIDKIRLAIENPEKVQTLRFRARRRDGSTIDVETVGRRLQDSADSPCVVFNWRDITERVQLFEMMRQRLESENEYLREEVREASGNSELLGASAGLRRVREQIEMVAPTDANVLIQGETGAGKELVARAIHKGSSRHDHSLIKINCSAIPRELFESEFFGHKKGAFSGALTDRIGRFQLADGGTLFLDEIGDLPMEMQPKLLRVLQDGEFELVGDNRTRRVNVRTIAASNRDLKGLVRAGGFREDLYYRLSVFPIEVPALRERRDDIPILAAHFLQAACKRFSRPGLQFIANQPQQLQNYDWPGNVRELQNVIERAVIASRTGLLQLDIPVDAVSESFGTVTDRSASEKQDQVIPDKEMSRRMRDNIVAALKRSGGRIYGPGGAAELLGIKPSTLSTRVSKLGLK
jgi:PAS domain S-box-containing protein